MLQSALSFSRFVQVRNMTFNVKTKTMFALRYNYVDNILEKRNQKWGDSDDSLRQQHFAYINKFVQNRQLILGGAFDPPSDGALIVLDMGSKTDAENFVSTSVKNFGKVK